MVVLVSSTLIQLFFLQEHPQHSHTTVLEHQTLKTAAFKTNQGSKFHKSLHTSNLKQKSFNNLKKKATKIFDCEEKKINQNRVGKDPQEQ